jgi:hypothetical protein
VRKRSQANPRYYPDIYIERLKKTTKYLSQDGPFPGRKLNQKLLAYEAGILPRREGNINKMDLRKWIVRMGVDKTSLGSRPTASLRWPISEVEPSGFASVT